MDTGVNFLVSIATPHQVPIEIDHEFGASGKSFYSVDMLRAARALHFDVELLKIGTGDISRIDVPVTASVINDGCLISLRFQATSKKSSNVYSLPNPFR